MKVNVAISTRRWLASCAAIVGLFALIGAATVGVWLPSVDARTSSAVGHAEDVGVNPVSVTASAGTPSAGYSTLSAAVAAINAGTHQGAITVNINSNITETASVVLNGSGAGSASYTSIVMRPSVDAVTISGPSVQGRGLIELNGADNVTIDGDNPNTSGTNRNLTIQNTAANTVTFTSVIRIALAATVITSADSNVIQNVNILGSATGRNIPAAVSTTASENTTFGIFVGPGASTATATTEPSPVTSVSTGIAAGGTATNLVIGNNAVTTAARAISINGAATTNFPGLQVVNNVIGNETVGAADQVYAIGITVQGSTNAIVRGNTVWVEGAVASSAAGHAINTGVNSANVSGTTIERNFVNRVRNNNPASWSAYGINLGGGTGHIVQNNFVSGVINDQTAGTGAFGTTFGAYGIRIGSGTGHRVYHNSVNLYGAMGGATSTNLTAAFLMSGTTQTGVEVRNNSFANIITGGNPTGTRHVAVFLPSAATSAMNLTTNNNGYFVSSDAQARLAQVGTTFGSGEFTVATFDPTATTPATNFRSYTSPLSAAGTNDNASFATLGSAPYTTNTNLRIPTSTATRLESGGAAVGVTADIDGEVRNATTPDIGADEFAGQPPAPNDMSGGSFVTPTSGALLQVGGAFALQASFVNQGSAAQTNVPVRYRIVNSSMTAVYNQTATIPTIAPLASVTVTFPSATITAAGSYTIEASAELPTDTAPGNNTISGSITALVPFTGNIDVGAGQTFTSLTNAGGLFQQLNDAGISGNVTINITSDLTTETGAVALNQLTEAGAGGYTVTIKPAGSARVISGTSAVNQALIKLNGADRVVIDGSLSGGTDRSLTITNSQNGVSSVIWIGAANASNGASNNTIRNCIINGTGTTTTQTAGGIIAGSGATIGGDAEAPNNNNTVTNNRIFAVQNSFFTAGNASLDQNWVVTNNEFGSVTEAQKNRFRGMLMGNAANFTISGNNILGVTSFDATTGAIRGIQLASSLTNGTVTNNRISNVRNLSTTGIGAFGMQLSATTTTNVLIANNFIWDIQAVGSAIVANNGHGITITGAATAGAYRIYHNSINMNVNQTTGTSAAINLTSAVVAAGAVDLRNNVLANTQTAGATRFAIFSAAPATVFSTINYNDYFAQNVGSLGGTTRTGLADWQAATTQDANSLAVDPLFVSATDLHLQSGSPMINAGLPLAGVTTDIDGNTRDAAPDLGADEAASAPAGVVQFTSGSFRFIENVGNAVFSLERIGGSNGTLTVNYQLSNGTATGGAACGGSVDFVNAGGSVTFANGQTSRTFTVPICADTQFEGNETFTAALVTGTVAGDDAGGLQTSTTATIVNKSGTGSDFDGDGRADLGVVRPVAVQTSQWFFSSSSNNGLRGYSFGLQGDVLTPGDFDGDGLTDPAIWRPGPAGQAAFYILNSSTQTVRILVFGQNGDVPVVADYDGDGKADPAAYRAGAQSIFAYIGSLNNPSNTATIINWGTTGDRPARGDFNGNGKADFAVFRNGTWWILRDDGSIDIQTFGLAGDRLVPADYDGDGRTDIAVFRPSNATWYLLRSSDLGVAQITYGLATDALVPDDYDGDGRADVAIFRNGLWIILQSANAVIRYESFGLAGDIPIPSTKVTP